MTIENNGPESAYQGPAEPGSNNERRPGKEDEAERNDLSDDPDLPVNPPVDEAEEPSPGSAV